MELIILILAIALILGLIIRKRGDNTMQTLSKGCGCLVFFVLVLIAVGVLYYKGYFIP
tara:strand:+ start:163 stop:336 length:174 start_codon:yes stop_codon:yes gene_type:complete